MMKNGLSNIELALEACAPKLAFTELTLGRVVGQGGFCTVREITAIDLDEVNDIDAESAAHRQKFAKAVREGRSYVLKTLRNDLAEDEHNKGILDLAIEVDFLKFLSHPNIITMRAAANSDPNASRFFIVLDRLTKTLDRMFNIWRKGVGENGGFYFPVLGYCCAKSNALHHIWKERFASALDVAKALQYLHSHDIVYRDLKPDNIGYDANGVLKVFDFGLAKRLDEVEKTTDGRYLLTGNTGSLRYMAPEVAKDEPYNLSVDSYSFGILLWQICSLTTPFAGYSQKMHADAVVRQGQRPLPDSTWPMSWVHIMEQCWDPIPSRRLHMDDIVALIEERLAALEEEEGVVPTRASEIRAKNRKVKVSPDNERLDVDTRIALESDSSVKKHDGEVV